METDASSAPVKTPPVDRKMWASFERGFQQVQFLLDHNRLLINEINQNHESKIPESLTRNVTLIRELNKNIASVVDLYSSISSSFVKSFENPSEVDSSAPSLLLQQQLPLQHHHHQQQQQQQVGAKTDANPKSPASGHKRVRSS